MYLSWHYHGAVGGSERVRTQGHTASGWQRPSEWACRHILPGHPLPVAPLQPPALMCILPGVGSPWKPTTKAALTSHLGWLLFSTDAANHFLLPQMLPWEPPWPCLSPDLFWHFFIPPPPGSLDFVVTAKALQSDWLHKIKYTVFISPAVWSWASHSSSLSPGFVNRKLE